MVKVNMGKPLFNWKQIPLANELNTEDLRIEIKDSNNNILMKVLP